MNTKQKVEVMLAFEAGKRIEVKCGKGEWKAWQGSSDPNWNWEYNEYRLKIPRKWFTVLNVHFDGSLVVRTLESDTKPAELAARVVQPWTEYE
jgi:hypothetical protein